MLGSSIAKFFKLDSLINDVTSYVETKLEIVKLEVKEEARKGLAKAITYLIIAFVFSLVIFFLSLGVAVVLSEILGSFWGYGIIAFFYLVAGIVLYLKREPLIKTFEKQISDTSKKN